MDRGSLPVSESGLTAIPAVGEAQTISKLLVSAGGRQSLIGQQYY